VDSVVRKCETEAPRENVGSRFFLCDLKPFFNTVNRAVEMLTKAGVCATVVTKETPEETVVTVRLVK